MADEHHEIVRGDGTRATAIGKDGALSQHFLNLLLDDVFDESGGLSRRLARLAGYEHHLDEFGQSNVEAMNEELKGRD